MKALKPCIIMLALLVAASFSAKAQLKLFGGKNHNRFLGDISFVENAESQSVWSMYSIYGATHSDSSIWNEGGIYGSKTSNYSPFNAKAKYPPQIRDASGKVYGYLTVNKHNANRSKEMIANSICDDRDKILQEGPENYGKIFRAIHCGGGTLYNVKPIAFKSVSP